MPTLDSLRADAVFGWRQLRKNKVTSLAAILSLALAIGACTAAFRLVDALLLRRLPVTAPDRLYVLAHRGIDFDGSYQTSDGWMYPLFRQLRAALADQADLMAVSYANRKDLTFGSDQDTEKAYLQYVSGWLFQSFGLRPALGRLLTTNDDLKPGAHPVAVLSYDYWTRRFARNPAVLGRTFRFGTDLYTIIGVLGQGFTGIEPGKMTDIFVPTMMQPDVNESTANWFRTLVHLKPGVAIEPVRQRLQAVYRSFREEQVKTITGFPKQTLAGIVNQKLVLRSAAAGVSDLQQDYQTPLAILSALVALLLLIACANVANLMTAQASARAREMALRVSIGAGRLRLVQLVLVESVMLAFLSSVIGAAFAWWSAPFVVSRIDAPDNPARLALPADWRVLCFAILLTFIVALLFGLAPALRASAIRPVDALKGGDNPHSRRHLMHGLIAIQVAFCFLVLFVAGLFIATLNRLSHQPLGFSPDRVLTLETVTQHERPPAAWNHVAERLRAVPGVESVALASWPLLSEQVEGGYISVAGSRPFTDPAFFLYVSPGWLRLMRIPFAAGRDFQPHDVFPQTVIVNEAFVKRFFDGQNALNKTFSTTLGDGQVHCKVVGVVRNARYIDLRGPMPPVAYFPLQAIVANGALRPIAAGAFIVRTYTSNPLALASILRREILHAEPGFRVESLRTQQEIIDLQTIEERLVAMLALFFAAVAVLLAGIGLYGVLDYSVFQRRREIGIRMAVGAQPADVARQATSQIFAVVFAGAIAGLALGLASVRYIGTLLYHVKPTDPVMLALPALTIIAAAVIAALPPLIRALRIDPVNVLRAE